MVLVGGEGCKPRGGVGGGGGQKRPLIRPKPVEIKATYSKKIQITPVVTYHRLVTEYSTSDMIDMFIRQLQTELVDYLD